MLLQIPLAWPVLALLQAMHAPPQALLQQTPSLHWLLVHSFAAPHVTPSAFFGWQTLPASQ